MSLQGASAILTLKCLRAIKLNKRLNKKISFFGKLCYTSQTGPIPTRNHRPLKTPRKSVEDKMSFQQQSMFITSLFH